MISIIVLLIFVLTIANFRKAFHMLRVYMYGRLCLPRSPFLPCEQTLAIASWAVGWQVSNNLLASSLPKDHLPAQTRGLEGD